MIFEKKIMLLLFSALTFFQCNTTVRAGEIVVDTSPYIPESLKPKISGTLVGKYSFSDKAGSHVLILIRNPTTVADGSNQISLHALQFVDTQAGWKQEWAINDKQVCKGLDIEAEFDSALTSVTDIDLNGVAESSVAYHMTCAGGIEPKPTKVIMRQGGSKYAVRGESLIQIDGVPSYGGTFTVDPILETKPALKLHLVSIWKKAAGFKN